MGWGARFAGVLMVGAVLSACGSSAGPEPRVLGEETAQPSADASLAGPAAPAQSLPKEVTDETSQAMQLFVRHWVEVANTALRSGDTKSLATLSAPSCDTCQNVIDDIESVYRKNGVISGGTLTVVDSSAPEAGDGVVPSVEVRAEAAPKTEYRKDGSIIASSDGETLTFVFTLRREDDSWLVAEIQTG